MKVLFVDYYISDLNEVNGRKIVSDRNLGLLNDSYGAENISCYLIPYYKSRVKQLFNNFCKYCAGLNFWREKRILDFIKFHSINIVFINTSQLGRLARVIKHKNEYIQVISFFHNIEAVFIQQMVGDFFFKKIKFHYFYKSVCYAENCALKYSDVVLTLNKRDSLEAGRLYGRNADFFLPITFNDKFNASVAKRNDSLTVVKKLLFVGSDFFGNTEGVFWFIDNCLDSINAEFIVVGSGMEKYQNRFDSKKVRFYGFVDNISDCYYNADAVVLPILSGSGMKTKTAEALMYGKTIFGTDEAFEGYEYSEKQIGFLCNSKEEFVYNINTFIKNQISKINNQSRELFLEYYETKHALKTIQQINQKILGR